MGILSPSEIFTKYGDKINYLNYLTRSDILQGQALFRGVKQLRKKMDKRQRDRQKREKKEIK